MTTYSKGAPFYNAISTSAAWPRQTICYPEQFVGETYDSRSDSFTPELAVGCGWYLLGPRRPRCCAEPCRDERTPDTAHPAPSCSGSDVCAFVVPVAAGWAARKTFRSQSSRHSRSGGCAGRSRHFADDLGTAASRPLLERQGRDQNQPPTHKRRSVCKASPSHIHGHAAGNRRHCTSCR
jgi:hypothetical protein